MKRFLKSVAQLLLIWTAIILALGVAAIALAAMDPLHFDAAQTHRSAT